VIRHSVTRYRIGLRPIVCAAASVSIEESNRWRWVQLAAMGNFPLPAAHQKIGRHLTLGLSDERSGLSSGLRQDTGGADR
jgi:hypothetical protein